MSWQPKVDELMATNKVSTAGLFGLNGDPFATSAGFSVSNDYLFYL
jgi:hypothetical protein